MTDFKFIMDNPWEENNPVMNMDPTGYNCVYQDLYGDGNPSNPDGGPCGGGGMGASQYLSSGGLSASTNDVYSTGYNSGMGNMISSHGPTSHWMNGIYSHGSFASSVLNSPTSNVQIEGIRIRYDNYYGGILVRVATQNGWVITIYPVAN